MNYNRDLFECGAGSKQKNAGLTSSGVIFHLVPYMVRQYVGDTAKLVALRKHLQLSLIPDRAELSEREIDALNAMHTFDAGKSVTVGDIKVTPYFVSHSACDAFMFLIEAEGYRILHTGDFELHPESWTDYF